MDDQPTDRVDRRTDLAIRVGHLGDATRSVHKLFDTMGIVCASADLARAIKMPEEILEFQWIKIRAMPGQVTL